MAFPSTQNPFVATPSGSTPDTTVAEERLLFMRQVYTHVAAAWLVFFAIECLILPLEITRRFTGFVLTIPSGWLAVLGAFMGVAWLARVFVHGGLSRPMQYLGLALYVGAEAVVFAPLLLVALEVAGPQLLLNAILLSGGLFAGLTALVFVTKKDFSFLRAALTVAGCISLGLILGAAAFGFSLGLAFSAGMIGLAGAGILYDTSRIMHDFEPEDYVPASLELFASMALLLWYVIRLLFSLARGNN